MTEESKKELLNLRSNLLTYLQNQPYYNPNRKGFFLCQDPEHSDTNPSMMYNKKNNTCHCFSCGATHDLFWFIQRDFELQSFGEAVNKAKELFDGTVSTNITSSYTPKEKNYTEYYNKIKNERPVDYLKKRGINEWIINAFELYYDKEHESLVIPTSESSYTERFLNVSKDSEEASRYKHFGSSRTYNTFPHPEKYMKEIPPIYIVEGELDALSILSGAGLGEGKLPDAKIKSEEIKALAIGLGSANNTYVLINELKKYNPEVLKRYNFVLALDNDRAGTAGKGKLAEEFSNLNLNFITANIYGNHKDANEALVKNKEKLQKNLEYIYEHFNQIKSGELPFVSAFDSKSNSSGKFLKINFISEDLAKTFKNYIARSNIEAYTDGENIYMPTSSGLLPKSQILGLLTADTFPSLEEYAAFNNMFIQNVHISENQLTSLTQPNIVEPQAPSNDLITAKLKYLISDAYKTYYGVELSEAYINSDDIYYHIENLKKTPLKSELSESEKTLYGELMKSIDETNPKFESFYTNYKKLTKDLLQKIKQENLSVNLDKEKLKDLGILNDNNKILKYPEFYKVLDEALKQPLKEPDAVAPTKQQDSSNKDPESPKKENKYINTKQYEKNVPFVLRNLPIFCCWKNVWDEQRNSYVKMPINPKNGHKAMTNEEERCFPPVFNENKQIVFDNYKDASGKQRRKIRRNFDGQFDLRRLSDDMCSWTDFKTACEAVDKWGCDGIGINAVKHLNLFLIDLDDVKDANGELNAVAKEFISQVPTYAEYSPSGTGIHMIGYADIDEKRAIRKNNVELYSAKHFITLTGNLVDGVPVKVCNKKSATPAINALIKKYLGVENATGKDYFHQQTSEYRFPKEENKQGFSNAEVIKRCSSMYEMRKEQYHGLNIFDELYEKGNWEPFFKSQSDADLFLVGRLKFFTTSKSQVDELFRLSGLMRDKWDQSVGSGFPYGMNTINYCFNKQQYSYTQQQKSDTKGIKE